MCNMKNVGRSFTRIHQELRYHQNKYAELELHILWDALIILAVFGTMWINHLHPACKATFGNLVLKTVGPWIMHFFQSFCFCSYIRIYLYLSISWYIDTSFVICLIVTSHVVCYFAKYLGLPFSIDVVLTLSILLRGDTDQFTRHDTSGYFTSPRASITVKSSWARWCH